MKATKLIVIKMRQTKETKGAIKTWLRVKPRVFPKIFLKVILSRPSSREMESRERKTPLPIAAMMAKAIAICPLERLAVRKLVRKEPEPRKMNEASRTKPGKNQMAEAMKRMLAAGLGC